MTPSNQTARLRDLPKAGPNAWLAASATATGFALLGVMLAVLSGAHFAVTSTETNVALAVFGAALGSTGLVALDRKLREVSA